MAEDTPWRTSEATLRIGHEDGRVVLDVSGPAQVQIHLTVDQARSVVNEIVRHIGHIQEDIANG